MILSSRSTPPPSSQSTYEFCHKGALSTFPVYKGNIYNRDSKKLIRTKCAVLIAATPVVTAARVVYHLSMTIFHTLFLKPILVLQGRLTWDQAKTDARQSLTDIFRSLIYGILMTGQVIKGLATPYASRDAYGAMERTLNRQEDGPHRSKWYTAFCFQYLENTESSAEKISDKLLQHIRKIQSIEKEWQYELESYQVEFKELKGRCSDFFSAIPSKYRKVNSRNIAPLAVAQRCFDNSLYDMSSQEIDTIGSQYGLSIRQGLNYRPSGGICLGMALTFLRRLQNTEESSLMHSATTLQGGADEESVKQQAIYHALFGVNGCASEKDIQSFLPLFWNIDVMAATPNEQSLADSVKAFLQLKNPSLSLREYVLQDLKHKQTGLSNKMYSVLLYLDKHHRMHYAKKDLDLTSYDVTNQLHLDATKALVESAGMQVLHAEQVNGRRQEIAKLLQEKPPGTYLIQLHSPEHSIAFTKHEDGTCSIFDSKSGLGIAKNTDEQQELVNHLFNHYYGSRMANLTVLSLRKMDEQP